MKTQTLDLNKMGLTPMNELEMTEVDGGKWWEVLLGIAVGIGLGLLIL